MKADSPIRYNGDLQILREYTIGAVIGVSYGALFDDAAKQGTFAKITRTNSSEANAKMLLLERFDIWVSNREQALFIMEKLHITNEIVELKPIIEAVPSYMAFSKKRELADIRNRFDEILAEMKADGTYEAIIDAYWRNY